MEEIYHTTILSPSPEKNKSSETEIIFFEQPLNEQIRICLRLEQLFQQTTLALHNSQPWQHRHVIEMLIQILNVVERSDLKTKLSSALTQHSSRLHQLDQNPHVDHTRLCSILHKIDNLIGYLYHHHSPLGISLRQNTFLETIRQYLYVPGGACNFNTPAYQLWLQRPSAERIATLQQWYREFAQLEDIVTTLLTLTRQGNKPERKIAIKGFFQEAINGNGQCELVRVSIPTDLSLYPEISVGRHRLSIRFLELSVKSKERPTQTEQDVIFDL